MVAKDFGACAKFAAGQHVVGGGAQKVLRARKTIENAQQSD
jgi:hypothetical protein